jgi:hypothetical protein
MYMYYILPEVRNKPLNKACPCLNLKRNLIYVLEHDVKISSISEKLLVGMSHYKFIIYIVRIT